VFSWRAGVLPVIQEGYEHGCCEEDRQEDGVARISHDDQEAREPGEDSLAHQARLNLPS
jgi:hypothetical protein